MNIIALQIQNKNMLISLNKFLAVTIDLFNRELYIQIFGNQWSSIVTDTIVPKSTDHFI